MTNLRDVKDRKDLANVHNLDQQVIDDFRANEGRVGGPFEGSPIILVHHMGAKTGTERVTPMTYFPQEDGSMVVVASNRGAPGHPAWYHNMIANPRINVEVGAENFPVAVVEITGEERETAWARIVAKMPGVDEYRKKVSRTIPLLRLTRVN